MNRYRYAQSFGAGILASAIFFITFAVVLIAASFFTPPEKLQPLSVFLFVVPKFILITLPFAVILFSLLVILVVTMRRVLAISTTIFFAAIAGALCGLGGGAAAAKFQSPRELFLAAGILAGTAAGIAIGWSVIADEREERRRKQAQ